MFSQSNVHKDHSKKRLHAAKHSGSKTLMPTPLKGSVLAEWGRSRKLESAGLNNTGKHRFPPHRGHGRSKLIYPVFFTAYGRYRWSQQEENQGKRAKKGTKYYYLVDRTVFLCVRQTFFLTTLFFQFLCSAW